MNKKYVIVEDGGVTWDYHFNEDPKLVGATIESSCFNSPIGKVKNIQATYTNIEDATKDCAMLNSLYPCDYYGVCPVK